MIRGRMRIDTIWNKSNLTNETIAETGPFPSAVKNADEKMLKPAKMYDIDESANAWYVRLKSSGVLFPKRSARGYASASEITTIEMENIAIILRLFFKSE
jgi:hypothetical protein